MIKSPMASSYSADACLIPFTYISIERVRSRPVLDCAAEWFPFTPLVTDSLRPANKALHKEGLHLKER